jgi:protein disulfide-isomerase A6
MLLDEFKKIINNEKPCIIMFYASWCDLSFEFINKFIELSNCSKDINFSTIDIDQNIDITDYCNINSSCIIQIYYKNKLKCETIFTSKEDLQQILKESLEFINKNKRIIYNNPIVIGDKIIYKDYKKIIYDF